MESDKLLDENSETEFDNGSLLSVPTVERIPRDRLKIVYFIFYLLGVGSLLPWNFFINGKNYFMYKLRNITLPKNFTDYDKPEYLTQYQVSFESYLAVAAMLPNVLFMFLNVITTRLIRLKYRIIFAVTTMIIIFAITISFAIINTDSWQVEFFAVTLVTIVIMNAASAILQGGVFGLSSVFPSQYPQAVMAGQAMGGTIAAVAGVISVAVTKNAQQSGLCYFSTALVVLIISLIAYLTLPMSRFANYHTDKCSRISVGRVSRVNSSIIESEENSLFTSQITEISFLRSDSIYEENKSTPLLTIFKLTSKYGFSICVVFFSTLASFPALLSAVRPIDEIQPYNSTVTIHRSEWQQKYFTPVICFLLFNLTDLIGRMLVGLVQWPKHGSRLTNLLPIFSTARIIFIPLFIFCNIQPRKIPILIKNDYFFAILITLFGISNGYLSTINMIYGPMNVKENDEETAGALMSFFLSLGLSIGSLFSFFIIHYIV